MRHDQQQRGQGQRLNLCKMRIDRGQIVINDEKMQETVDSIKEYGVLNPCIVRPREGGGYEIISGHRRKYACQLAGKAKIPAIIRNYTDDEATIIMVDSVRP